MKMNSHYPIRFHDKCEEINRTISNITVGLSNCDLSYVCVAVDIARRAMPLR